MSTIKILFWLIGNGEIKAMAHLTGEELRILQPIAKRNGAEWVISDGRTHIAC